MVHKNVIRFGEEECSELRMIRLCLMEAKPNAEKEADALIALFQGCFNRRKEIEAVQWKMNLSLWTSIIVGGWALHTRPKPERLGYWSLTLLLVVFVHLFATIKFETSIRNAVKLALAYVNDLEALIGHRHVTKPAKLYPWYVLQVAPTLLLTVAATILLW